MPVCAVLLAIGGAGRTAAFTRALGPAAVIGIAMPTALVTALGPLTPIGVAIRSAVAVLRRTEPTGFAVLPRRPLIGCTFAVAVLDDAVEPFADRYAGWTRAWRGVPGGLMRSRTVTFEIPRTAKFHSRAQTAGTACARFRAGARQETTRAGRSSIPSPRLLRIMVNRRLSRFPTEG